MFFDLEQLSNFWSGSSVTRTESSEVIFVILLEVVLPTGRGFPDCLISHINHTLFITITRAALCAAVASALEGNSMRKCVNRLNWAFGISQRTKCIIQDQVKRHLSISPTWCQSTGKKEDAHILLLFGISHKIPGMLWKAALLSCVCTSWHQIWALRVAYLPHIQIRHGRGMQ